MKLIIATGNQGKLKEFNRSLEPLGYEVLSSKSLGISEPDETGESFSENALIKARNAALTSQLPCLADDSGLSVEALDGKPGIRSARWAGPEQDYHKAMKNVHEALSGKSNRKAYFICVLALLESPDAQPVFFEGKVEGEITWPPRGDKGFGYDPFFVPQDLQGKTFAELSAEQKQSVSHRGRAIKGLVKYLQTRFDEKAL